MIRIPYCFCPERILRRTYFIFYGPARHLRKIFPLLEFNLKRANIDMPASKYLSYCLFSNTLLLLFTGTAATLILYKLNLMQPFLTGPAAALLLLGFILTQQVNYPATIIKKRVRSIEQNLLSALRTLHIQINAGVPLYSIMSRIANEDYGEVSKEFKKAVDLMNVGKPQVNALESIATESPSFYFQRAIWQIITSIRSGASVSKVLKEIIDSLSDEELIQVQDYGSKLNPLTMFYMLMIIIVPALAITFLVIIGSFISASGSTIEGLFWGLFIVVLTCQIIFLNIIASKRPSLLGGR